MDKTTRSDFSQIPGVSKPVSRLFFGTAIKPMALGGDAGTLLDEMLALGVNAFDCARGYGGAERSLGRWVRERGNREEVVILSKCGNVGAFGRVHINRQVIERELHQSLRALGMDYIDIYLLHRDDPKTPLAGIIETLNELKQKGFIRAFGVSNWTHERIEEANAYAASKGLNGFSASSPNYGLAVQCSDPWGGRCVTLSGPESAGARAWYAENRMPVIAYSSLGRGFFSGRFQSGDYAAAKKILDGPAQKGYLCEENMERLRRAEILAKDEGCTVSEIAMRYIFSSDMNLYAIVSTTSPERMRQNIDASLRPLSEDAVRWLQLECSERMNRPSTGSY